MTFGSDGWNTDLITGIYFYYCFLNQHVLDPQEFLDVDSDAQTTI